MARFRDTIAPKIRQNRILFDVTLELTYSCNLKCFFCYNDLSKKGTMLSLSQYRELLTGLADMGTMLLMLTGGEPMIHPNFFEIGAMTKDLGFVTRIRTNGHSLTENICNRLRLEVDPHVVEVSLHGASAETHDKQTLVPGSFNRLVNNIQNAVRAGLKISVVTTPTAWNEHQIDEMYALCDSLQVPLRFQGPVAPRDNGDKTPLAIQPTESAWEKISHNFRTRKEEVMEQSPPRIYESPEVDIRNVGSEPKAVCGVGVAGVDIDPFGNVQACLHLQESAGSLHDNTIREIWEDSPLFTRARSRAINEAKKFVDIPVKQLGAPLYCMAVEENLNKSCDTCSDGRGSRTQ